VRIVDTTTGSEESYEEKKVLVNNIGTVFIVETNDNINSVSHSISLHDVTNEDERLD
jgi:hypothetical protein